MQTRQRPRSFCAEIVERVADRKRIDMVSLPPLHDTVDADALETLAEQGARIDFEYAGFRVVVDGGVRIRRQSLG